MGHPRCWWVFKYGPPANRLLESCRIPADLFHRNQCRSNPERFSMPNVKNQIEDLTESELREEAPADLGETDGSEEGELQLEESNKFITVAPDKNDRSLAEFHRWYKRKRLVVDPE